MRKVVDWKYLRRTSILKLIDALIKPILMYGCDIWLPYVAGTTITEMQASSKSSMPSRTMSGIGKLAFEQVHLQMGVNKKTSNSAVFGGTGRYPLLITHSKQIIDYYQRIKTPHDKADILELAKDAFEEHKLLQLEWIAVIENVT